MAKSATIYKAELNIADIDRNYYAEHDLTLACHPSETEERMMVRLLAFVLFANEDLAFGGGVSTQGEPALWEKDPTGSIRLWIELGHPDEKDLRRSCGKSRRVVVLCYGGRASTQWWEKNREALDQKNLTVIELPPDQARALGRMAERKMRLQCNVQDEIVSIISGESLVQLELRTHLGARIEE